MLPKRKLIKKQYIAPETSLNEEATNLYVGDLIQQLKSEDMKVKADAISAIANLQQTASDLEQELISLSTLKQLTTILCSANSPSMIQTTLFAINNLCVLEASSNRAGTIIKNLFAVGLDKALIGLDSNDANLIKPILILMGTIADYVPPQYKYLIQGVQKTIISNCQKYLQQKYADLVMQFLIQSNATVSPQITPEERTCIQMLQRIAETDKLYRNRAMASRLQASMVFGKYKECIDLFCANFEEFITDIDLQAEYKANFANKDLSQQQFQQKEGQDEEEQEEEAENVMMIEEKNKKGQHKEAAEKQAQPESPYNIFIDALEGIQVMLQFIVDQFEDEAEFTEAEEEEDEMEEEQGGEQKLQTVTFQKSMFLPGIQNSLNRIMKNLHKYACLSFIEGQNIIELILRLVLSMPSNFTTSKQEEGKIPQVAIIGLVEQIIVNEFKFQMKNPLKIPQEVFIFNVKTGLQCILKYKIIVNRNIYTELPYLKYEVQPGHSHQKLDKVVTITSKWKQFWINLLEIYSMFYNPEKIATVTENQNKEIGGTLKQLILEIPEVQLEEWRGQAVDTLFDVYSNENFDSIFMDYGFVQILSQVLKVAAGGHSKMGVKSKKTTKFVNAVVADIQRFIAYKKKMIGF